MQQHQGAKQKQQHQQQQQQQSFTKIDKTENTDANVMSVDVTGAEFLDKNKPMIGEVQMKVCILIRLVKL